MGERASTDRNGQAYIYRSCQLHEQWARTDGASHVTKAKKITCRAKQHKQHKSDIKSWPEHKGISQADAKCTIAWLGWWNEPRSTSSYEASLQQNDDLAKWTQIRKPGFRGLGEHDGTGEHNQRPTEATDKNSSGGAIEPAISKGKQKDARGRGQGC